MQALVAADHPDITVSVGEDVCSCSNSCTDYVVQELVFRGDTAVTGTSGGGEFTLNDWRYVARTRGTARTVKSRCTDTEDADTWLVWRKARLSVDGGAE